jgi:protease-4
MDSNSHGRARAQRGWLARLGGAITWLRHFTGNLLFLLLLLVVLSALLGRCQSVQLPAQGALVIDPAGAVVESPALTDPLQGLLNPQLQVGQVAIEDLVRAIDLGREDSRINLLVLRLDEVSYLSLTHAEQLGDAVARFRASGKRVEAYGYAYEQVPYLVASQANAVYLHPMGQLMLPGLASYRLYWKGLLEKLGLDVEVFRVGTYKSFVEPYLRQDMSEPVREETLGTLTALWDRMLDRISANRDLESVAVRQFAENYVEAISSTGGDLARAALEANLVDELLTEDEARSRLAETAGRLATGDYVATGYEQYLAVAGPRSPATTPYVSVLTLEGPIVLSAPGGGAIGAEEVSEQLRAVARDDNARALVLRVNSPGGSSFASELIRKELELLQVRGKPVVISMGPTAASGGYWISATADEIVAEPTTITGSIGAFSIFPSARSALAEAGVSSDGVATTPLAGGLSPVRGLNDPLRAVLQQSLEQVYEQFANLVARGRQLDPAAVEALAGGRIWTGTQALERGLADHLGGVDLALERAAALAGIEDPGVRYLVPERSARSALIAQLLDMAQTLGVTADPVRGQPLAAALRALAGHPELVGTESGLARSVAPLLLLLAEQDPRGVFSYCQTCPPAP